MNQHKYNNSENLDMHLKNMPTVFLIYGHRGGCTFINGHRGGCKFKSVCKKLLMATRTVVDTKWL